MKRAEYIEAARRVLAKYGETYEDDFIRTLEDHFDEGESEGKSEEELCEELGPIEDVLEEMEQAIGKAMKESESGNASSAENAQPDKPSEAQKSFALQAVPRVKAEAGQITDIKANLGIADVKITKTSDTVPSVHLEDEGASLDEWNMRLDEKVHGATYSVKLVSLQKESGKKGLLERFINVVTTPVISLVLLVPESIQSLELTGTSGDVKMDELKVTNINVHTSSGDVEVKKCSAVNFQANSTSGDIAVSDSAAQSLTIASASGDVDAKRLVADAIAVNGMSSDVDLEIEGDTKCKISTMSGDVEIQLNNEGRGLRATVSSMSGSTDISYGNKKVRQNGVHRIGGEASSIEVKSMSGDVMIS